MILRVIQFLMLHYVPCLVKNTPPTPVGIDRGMRGGCRDVECNIAIAVRVIAYMTLQLLSFKDS